MIADVVKPDDDVLIQVITTTNRGPWTIAFMVNTETRRAVVHDSRTLTEEIVALWLTLAVRYAGAARVEWSEKP